VEHLRRQVGKLKAHEGFDVTPEQRLAYPMSEVGEVAEEVLGLSRNGNADVGTTDSEGAAAVRERFGGDLRRRAEPSRSRGRGPWGRLREEGQTERGQRMVAKG
jgi:hypothetical protein